jgi:hypothetical protein
MPASKVQLSGGAFQDALGNVVANGYIIMQLSQDAQVTGASPEIQITAGRTLKINLDSSGNIAASPAQYAWPNDVLTPANTYYTVAVYTASGQLVWGPNAQQVLSTPSPYDVGLWSPRVVNVAAPITQTIYDVGVFFPGTFANAQVMLYLKLERNVTFSAQFSPSTAVCQVNPTGAVSVSILKNGTSVGSIAFSTGGVATFSGSAVTFSVGDILEITAPATADATFANVGIILSGVTS